ncbi:hypothetical protein AYI69_g9045 [Smittium culicis]|uniref:Retrotransposon gag domain-containing protein n=1 Tax=Smittium culicis TaxID=133412 RepID=A0A1R1XFF8_9FUNG|nr:hypothetical protein AYI69_g9045 [Smittium culicis]
MDQVARLVARVGKNAAMERTDIEILSETSDWTLEKWLQALSDKFSKKGDANGSIFTLIKLQKVETKDMDLFNSRFKKYKSTIPEIMYTEELVKKVYKDILLAIERDLWWKCTKLREKTELGRSNEGGIEVNGNKRGS